MTTVRHSLSKLGFAWSPGTGSLDGGTAVVLGVLTLDCVYHPPHIPADKTYGLCYYVAGQCLIVKAQQEPSFALSVWTCQCGSNCESSTSDQNKGEIWSTSLCFLVQSEFLAYFEWMSVDFIHFDAHILVLGKRGIRDEMYQFSMLSTPFSFCIGAIDSNPVSLPEAKRPSVFIPHW